VNFQRGPIRFLRQVLGDTYTNYNIIKLRTRRLFLFSLPADIIDLCVVVCAYTYKYDFQRVSCFCTKHSTKSRNLPSHRNPCNMYSETQYSVVDCRLGLIEVSLIFFSTYSYLSHGFFRGHRDATKFIHHHHHHHHRYLIASS